MNSLFEINQWTVKSIGFDNQKNEIVESVMSLGNGHMGLRGNFEETFSGETLKGTYIAGIYYPDKTKVSWWKNGYPEYFAKVLNACDFISVELIIDGEIIDVNHVKLDSFIQELDMKSGTLSRMFSFATKSGKRVQIDTLRFVSMHEKEKGAIRYAIHALDSDITVELKSRLDGNVKNTDSNYDEMFWSKVSLSCDDEAAYITLKTKKTEFIVSTAKTDSVKVGNVPLCAIKAHTDGSLLVEHIYHSRLKPDETLTLEKYFSSVTSRDHPKSELNNRAVENALKAKAAGFDQLLKDHKRAWAAIWAHSDIEIKGDDASQQGIRFNIFQLNQTYTGRDNRLNIGPKGFTGEKYGGGTYWDTEVFCLPFFLSTAESGVAKSLLVYRYNQLDQAKENAAKLGLNGALYPMVTMNGEECHNEWEITFEEIHRNAAIALAIKNYVDYTGDTAYLGTYGLGVLVETARFWASRVNFNTRTQKYMILGVTGPNEYENNVNNNWYTNQMAAFSLGYTLQTVEYLKANSPADYQKNADQYNIMDSELEQFSTIAQNMYYPYIEEFDVFAQQDGYTDKELLPADSIAPEDRPINQHWSWDRILRSCFIKQADVIQYLYNFPFAFDLETKRRNFNFYEPMTVHESSLSSCIYSVIASELGYQDKAYALYLRASRLDLDNYNNDTEDGLHITATTGSWISIVHGFGGLRVRDNHLILNPVLPKAWQKYAFNLCFRGAAVKVTVGTDEVIIRHIQGDAADITVYNSTYNLADKKEFHIPKVEQEML